MNNRKRIFAMLCLLLIFGANLVVEAYQKTIDLFDTSYVEIDNNYTISEKTGIKLIPYKQGATAAIDRNFSGEFLMNFCFEDSGLKSFTLLFESLTETKKFGVRIYNEKDLVNVGVETEETVSGLYYVDDTLAGKTQEKNLLGQYTYAVNDVNTFLRFDPDTMNVYVGNNSKQSLVWSLNQSVMDGKKIDSVLNYFNEYSVSIKFGSTDYNSGLFLSSINNQKLNGAYLIDNAAPVISANVELNGLKGERYYLPKASAFDVVDGKITDIQVAVYRGRTEVLAKQNYSEDLYFTPTSLLGYTITYFTKDANGNSSKKSYNISVLETAADAKFTNNSARSVSDYGVGSKIYFSDVSGVSELKRKPDALSVLVTVKRNGTILPGYEKIHFSPKDQFTFENVGEYTFIFSFQNKNLTQDYTLTYRVDDSLPVISAVSLKGFYALDDKVSFEDAIIKVNGKEYQAERIIYYPDGNAYIGEEAVLNITGNYTVEYRVVDNNQVYKYRWNFVTGEKVLSSDDKTTIFYGTNPNFTEDYAKIVGKDSLYGMNVSLGMNSVLKYNKVIDLRNKKANDYFIEILMTPEAGIECTTMYIVLTDIYDSSNYVQIRIKQNSGEEVLTYTNAAAYNQQWAGSEREGQIHKNTDWGHTSWGSFARSMGAYPFRIAFDYEQRQIHTCTGFDSYTLVADLDSLDHFSEIWEGFTTGEAYLSIYCDGYTASQANMFVLNIDGADFSEEVVRDSIAPRIFMDYGNYAKNSLPDALVGQAYQLFAATAVDSELGNVHVQRKVYFGYGTDSQTEIDSSNGKFTPLKAGLYTIVNTAQDQYGNLAQEIYTVEAKNEHQEIELIVDEIDGRATLGGWLVVRPVIIRGGNGDVNLTIHAISPSQNKINIENNRFIPTEAGNYRIVYTAVDYLGIKKEVSYYCFVSISQNPVFIDEVELPNVFIAGKEYVLELPDAYDYYTKSGVRQVVTPQILIEDGNGSHILEGNVYTPYVSESGQFVRITYKAQTASGVSTLVYEVPVKVVKTGTEFDMTQYFYGDVETIATADWVSVIFNRNASFEFVQDLYAENFLFNFAIDTSRNHVGEVVIYLYDSLDKTICVKIVLRPNTNHASAFSNISVNDGSFAEITGSFYDALNNVFFLSYNNTSHTLSDNTKFTNVIKNTLDGKKFDGFSSSAIRMVVEAKGVVDSFALNVININSQKFSSSKVDRVSPMLYIEANDELIFDIGITYTISKAKLYDVLDYATTLVMTVTDNEGEIVQAIDGTLLRQVSTEREYQIVLNQIGTYTIVYSGSDSSGRKITETKILNVLDKTAPEITVNGTLKTKYKVGENLTLPTYQAVDNVDGNVDVLVLLYDKATGRTINVSTLKYKFAQTGKYKLYFIALDSFGNLAVSEHSVDVE